MSQRPICIPASKIGNSESGAVRRCRVHLASSGATICGRHLRARLLEDKDVKWTVYEMFVSSLNVTEHWILHIYILHVMARYLYNKGRMVCCPNYNILVCNLQGGYCIRPSQITSCSSCGYAFRVLWVSKSIAQLLSLYPPVTLLGYVPFSCSPYGFALHTCQTTDFSSGKFMLWSCESASRFH